MANGLPAPTAEILALYQIINASLVSLSLDYRMEIGDSMDPSDFIPQIKLVRSPKILNEFSFSLRLLKSTVGAVVSFDHQKIVQSFPDGTVARFFNVGASDETGGFEWDIFLPTPPPDSIVPFSVRSKGLAFFPQPTLANVNPDGSSWEANAEGGFSRRPAEINESIAVYFSGGQRHNRYKTGKAFHLNRPSVLDADGDQLWCDWILDNQNRPVGVRIPDDANYPLRLDPTLGYSTIGAGYTDVNESFLHTSSDLPYTMTENGTATVFYVVLEAVTYGVNIEATYGIYNGTGVTTPVSRSRVGQTAGATITPADGVGFRSQAISAPLTSGESYYLSFNTNVPTSTTAGSRYDAIGATGFWLKSSTYSAGALPDPWPATSDGQASAQKLISAYIDYTVGVPDLRPRRSQFMLFFPPTTR